MIGDAVHATLPNLGQGANLAIGDGIALAKELAAIDLSNDASVEEAFEAAKKVREPYTTHIVQKTRQIDTLDSATSSLGCISR